MLATFARPAGIKNSQMDWLIKKLFYFNSKSLKNLMKIDFHYKLAWLFIRELSQQKYVWNSRSPALFSCVGSQHPRCNETRLDAGGTSGERENDDTNREEMTTTFCLTPPPPPQRTDFLETLSCSPQRPWDLWCWRMSRWLTVREEGLVSRWTRDPDADRVRVRCGTAEGGSRGCHQHHQPKVDLHPHANYTEDIQGKPLKNGDKACWGHFSFRFYHFVKYILCADREKSNLFSLF